jgi:hypothetical protein
MAGAIIENMSGRKLAMIGSVLILCQIICFLVGAVFSPAPNNSDQFLATKVTDKEYVGYIEDRQKSMHLRSSLGKDCAPNMCLDEI